MARFQVLFYPGHQPLPAPDAIRTDDRIFIQAVRSRLNAWIKPAGWPLTPLGPFMVIVSSDREGLQPWSEQDLNLQHPYYQYGALPIELSSPDTWPRQIPCSVHTAFTARQQKKITVIAEWSAPLARRISAFKRTIAPVQKQQLCHLCEKSPISNLFTWYNSI